MNRRSIFRAGFAAVAAASQFGRKTVAAPERKLSRQSEMGAWASNFEHALKRYPRIRLFDQPTPIQRLRRVEAALGPAADGIALYGKRDDFMSLGGGGNKLRKLEFLLGDAPAAGADTIITVGGRQSNHARLTAAAAAHLGLRCELVLVRMVPRDDIDYVENGNILLNNLFGALVHDLPGGADALAYANERASTLRAQGRKAYVVPLGGSSPIGCLGYAACAHEIQRQSEALQVDFGHIVVPNGSSGTHAGLAAGYVALERSPAVVRSFAVLAGADATRQATIEKARATLALLDESAKLDESRIDVRGSQLGAGYGIPTDAMLEAVRLIASAEGVLLDPVYSGKALAGLLASIRAGEIQRGANVLFVMTGGTPALFAYRRAFEVA
jgi:D-cysteine desulfhydrase